MSESLDRQLLRSMIANRGFSWVFAQLDEIYEDTDKCAMRDPYGQEFGVYVDSAIHDLLNHFEEVEGDS